MSDLAGAQLASQCTRVRESVCVAAPDFSSAGADFGVEPRDSKKQTYQSTKSALPGYKNGNDSENGAFAGVEGNRMLG